MKDKGFVLQLVGIAFVVGFVLAVLILLLGGKVKEFKFGPVVVEVPANQSTQQTIDVQTPTPQSTISTAKPVGDSEQPALTAPTSPEEAAALFGGAVELWKPCPEEPPGCWTFTDLGKSHRISVPSACLNPDNSIDGWRYGGGYPDKADVIEGDYYIWEDLEGATIRCY